MKRLGFVVLGSPLILLVIAIVYSALVPGGTVGLMCVLPAAAVLVVPIMILLSADPEILNCLNLTLWAGIFIGLIVWCVYEFVLIFLNRGDEVSWIPAATLGIIVSLVLSARYRAAAIASLVIGGAMLLLRLMASPPISGTWTAFLDPDCPDIALVIIGFVTYLDHENTRVAKTRWRSYAKDRHLDYEEADATFTMNGDFRGRALLIRAAALDSGSGVLHASTVIEVTINIPPEVSLLLKWRLGIIRYLRILSGGRSGIVKTDYRFDRFYHIVSYPEDLRFARFSCQAFGTGFCGRACTR